MSYESELRKVIRDGRAEEEDKRAQQQIEKTKDEIKNIKQKAKEYFDRGDLEKLTNLWKKYCSITSSLKHKAYMYVGNKIIKSSISNKAYKNADDYESLCVYIYDLKKKLEKSKK